MSNSENPTPNVISASQRFSTKSTPTLESEEEPLAMELSQGTWQPELQIHAPDQEMMDATMQHLQHVNAEINTAAREGYYVHMGVPELIVVSATTDGEGNLDIVADFRLQYGLEKLDPKRVVLVDHRPELQRKREGQGVDPEKRS